MSCKSAFKSNFWYSDENPIVGVFFLPLLNEDVKVERLIFSLHSVLQTFNPHFSWMSCRIVFQIIFKFVIEAFISKNTPKFILIFSNSKTWSEYEIWNMKPAIFKKWFYKIIHAVEIFWPSYDSPLRLIPLSLPLFAHLDFCRKFVLSFLPLKLFQVFVM